MKREKQMNFNLEMEKRQEKITGILEYYLPKEEGFQKTVLEAMNYSMRALGGRGSTQVPCQTQCSS